MQRMAGRERSAPPPATRELCRCCSCSTGHLCYTPPHLTSLITFLLPQWDQSEVEMKEGEQHPVLSSDRCASRCSHTHTATQTQTRARARTHSPDLDSDSVFVSISFEVYMGKKFTGGQTSIIDACSSCVTILRRFCFSPLHLLISAYTHCLAAKTHRFEGAHLPPCAAHSLSKHPPCMYFETSRAEELFRCWSREREEGG